MNPVVISLIVLHGNIYTWQAFYMIYTRGMTYGSNGAGKGSSPRHVNLEQYGKNYEAIFKKKPVKKKPKKTPK